MKTKRFAFAEGGPERLAVTFGRGLGQLSVEMDGRQVNAEPLSRDDVKHGSWVILNDGSRLWVQRNRNGLELARDGVPLPGSATHSGTIAKGASNILYFIAALTVAASLLLYLDLDVALWIGLGSALVFGVLAFFVRRGSLVALWVGLILYSLDAIFSLVNGLSAGQFPLLMIAVKVALIVGLARAVPALQDLRRKAVRSVVA